MTFQLEPNIQGTERTTKRPPQKGVYLGSRNKAWQLALSRYRPLFGAIGWHSVQVDEKTGDYSNANDKVALQMMKWVPYDQWGHMNRCYAGLGQLLNERHESVRIAIKLLEKATREQRPEIFKILREYKVTLLGQNK